MFKHLFCSTAALALACTGAHAGDIRISGLGDEGVVVSATRLATPARQICSSVSVITAGDIAARQQISLADVLRDVPGLDIAQSGGAGAQTSIFLRGTNSNQVKVLLDGPSPEIGATILAGDKPVGTIGSTAGGKGIALVRIDRVADALDAGQPLTAGGLALTLAEPETVRISTKQPTA